MNYLFTILLASLISINAQASITDEDTTANTINKSRLWAVAGSEAIFFVAGNAYLQYIWYKDHERTPFHFYNDNNGWMQVDKVAHAYVAYQQSALGYHSLRWAGVSKTRALMFGGTLGLVLQTPVEIFDGIYEGYGFSKGDMIANASGSLLFIAQELAWDAQHIKMKFSYSPSPYAQHRPAAFGKTHASNFFTDYNAHTYWLSGNLSSLLNIPKLPSWLNIAVGYSANGMLGEFYNPRYSLGKELPEFERERQLILSLDVDFSRIKTKNKILKPLFKAINLVKIPAPALQYNKKGFSFNPVYF